METIKRIISTNRRKGSTTWILKAAINDPNCIIIAANREQSDYMKAFFVKLRE